MTDQEVMLWLDDERPMPTGYTHMVQSSEQAIQFLRRIDLPMFRLISFDHDLGELLLKRRLIEDTSRRVLLWMIAEDVWPREIRVHTANPVGRDWLFGTAARYSPAWCYVNPSNPYRTGWR